jgi:cytochrome P450
MPKKICHKIYIYKYHHIGENLKMELYDPFDKEWLKNKFKFYDEIRQLDKAYWSEKYKMYVYTRNADVIYILSNPDIFISGQGNLVRDQPYRFGKTPGASDGKRHSYFRKSVKDAYSKSRIDAVNKSIEFKATELLSKCGTEQFDIAHIIRVVSSYMSAEIINLPGVDKEYLTDLILDIQLNSDRTVLHNTDNTKYNEFVGIIKDLLANNVLPEGSGIYKEFTENEVPHPYVSLFTGPVISGCYSMISALEFTVYNLYQENVLPELLENLDLIPNAVDEALRFNATTGKFARTVAKCVTLHGIDLKVGDKVAVCLDAGSRDPAMFDNPNKFDLHRKIIKSTPFGYGIHACAGQAIARAGLEQFLKTFLKIIGNYEVITKPEDLDYIITSSANNDVITELLIKKV